MMTALLVLVGVAVGLIGTLVGAGGGFLVVPFLVLVMGVPPALAAGTSTVMVAANAGVGTIAHARGGRVDWLAGLLLAAASYPGSLVGAYIGTHLEASEFNLIFGLLLVALAIWMVIRSVRGQRQEAAAAGDTGKCGRGPLWLSRRLHRGDGSTYTVAFYLPLAVAGSVAVGVLGGMLGIGGGPLLVPFLIFGLGYPAHAGAATSQFNIFLTALGTAALYLARGALVPTYAIALSSGVVVGAPVGAWLATRIQAKNLVWLMSGLLFFVGLKLAL